MNTIKNCAEVDPKSEEMLRARSDVKALMIEAHAILDRLVKSIDDLGKEEPQTSIFNPSCQIEMEMPQATFSLTPTTTSIEGYTSNPHKDSVAIR